MKYALIMALAMLPWATAAAQDAASCKAYFQVLWTEPGTPGLHLGLDSGQKNWWQDKGRKKYPRLCLNGTVTSNDKPRFLVIWSKARSFGPFSVNSSSKGAAVGPDEIYGQKYNALLAAAPKDYIYKERWDVSSITILSIAYDGTLELPPVYLAPKNLKWGVLWSDSAKVLDAAANYLVQDFSNANQQAKSRK
jgi:hypothetical protein